MAKSSVKTTKASDQVSNTKAPIEGEKEITMENHSNGKRKVILANMPKVRFTMDEFNKLDPKGIVDVLIDPKNPAINRIGRERAQKFLIDRISKENIKVTPAALMDLTYKNVRVNGIDSITEKKIRGVKEPKVTLTTEEFQQLTPEKIVEWVGKYTHKRRIADSIIPSYIAAGMPVTAEDVVYLTNGRVEIEGITNPTYRGGSGRGKKASVIVEGLAFS